MNNGNKHGAADGYYKELFADHKNSASECNESSLSNCRAQPILSKSLYSLPADDISARTGKNKIEVIIEKRNSNERPKSINVIIK